MSSVRFPYVDRLGTGNPADWMPWVPIKLRNATADLDEIALVDSGASVNVLPHSKGVLLGADWSKLAHPMPVRGARGLIPGKLFSIQGLIAGLPLLPLVFSWIQSDDIPLILGQINFFHEVDVLFSRSNGYFELTKRP